MSAPFDIYDRATLTDLVNRPIKTMYEDQTRLGDLIAPVQTLQGREAKLRVYAVEAFGKGKFKAPDATPELFKPRQTWREEVVSLVELEEMERISYTDYMKLRSPDPIIRREAGVELITRGQILAMRNERLTEWMRWQAFSGSMEISYDNGNTTLFVDYGLPTGHRPTATTAWTDTTNADPVADIRAWSETIAASSGYFGTRVHMSSETYEYLIRNAKLKALLTDWNRSMLIPSNEDVMSQLREGTEIIIYDNGYRDGSVSVGVDNRGIPGSLTRYLPEGKVLVTTDYRIEGQNIAETLEGQVVVSTGYNSLDIRQGPQSEVIVDHMTKNHYWRHASARIPRIIYPECFLWATAYTP